MGFDFLLPRLWRRVLAIALLELSGTTSGWLSMVVVVELDERRPVDEREVVVVLVRVLTEGRCR